MDLVVDKIYKIQHFYEWTLSISDKRVNDWLLMDSYSPTIALTILYIVTSIVGPKFMETQKPFNLNNVLVFYNLIMVLMNFHICKEIFTASWRLNYSYSCQMVDYSDNPDEVRIARAIWWFYISKLVEMLDTMFFILRKKNNQITFLHVYHHATMFPIWWIGVKWVAGGQSFFGVMVNSGVHVLMYTYYGLAACGPTIQKYLWWKKYLTKVQLIQFVCGIAHAVNSLVVRCDFPIWTQWAFIIYAFSILALFLNFYARAYLCNRPKNRQTIKPKVGTPQSRNAIVGNGTVQNGTVQNGYDHVSQKNGVLKKHN